MICAFQLLAFLSSAGQPMENRSRSTWRTTNTPSPDREARSRCTHAITKRVGAPSTGISDDHLCVTGITHSIRPRQQSDPSEKAEEHGCVAEVQLRCRCMYCGKWKRRTPSMSVLHVSHRTLPGYGLEHRKDKCLARKSHTL